MPRSTRLKRLEADKQKQASAIAKRTHQEEHREPQKCVECYKRAACHGCNSCQRCYEELQCLKEELLLLCQSCPGLAQVQRHIEKIVQAADVLDVAQWIENSLELDISQPSKNITARWIQILGWKGAMDFDKLRPLNSSTRNDISYNRLIENNVCAKWNIGP